MDYKLVPDSPRFEKMYSIVSLGNEDPDETGYSEYLFKYQDNDSLYESIEQAENVINDWVAKYGFAEGTVSKMAILPIYVYRNRKYKIEEK